MSIIYTLFAHVIAFSCDVIWTIESTVHADYFLYLWAKSSHLYLSKVALSALIVEQRINSEV